MAGRPHGGADLEAVTGRATCVLGFRRLEYPCLIVLCTLASGVLSVLAAGLFLALPGRQREAALPHLVSFATGALLGAALLALIPHAVIGAGTERVHEVGIALIAGIALFFVLEKFLLWRHCHDDHCDEHAVEDTSRPRTRPRAPEGQRLTGAGRRCPPQRARWRADRRGISHRRASRASSHGGDLAHEIPQEVGNFAVLLHSGISRRRALALNLLTSLTAVIGGVVGYFALQTAVAALPFALAVAAASLLYVAVADLIPGLHRRVDPRSSITQVLLIGCGIAIIAFAENHAH